VGAATTVERSPRRPTTQDAGGSKRLARLPRDRGHPDGPGRAPPEQPLTSWATPARP
jgi:hypothetical protein